MISGATVALLAGLLYSLVRLNAWLEWKSLKRDFFSKNV
jgi:hypothetical protein